MIPIIKSIARLLPIILNLNFFNLTFFFNKSNVKRSNLKESIVLYTSYLERHL